MSKAFFYRGLSVEFDTDIPRLTVDGYEIPLPSTLEGAPLSDLVSANTDALVQHAQRYVDASADARNRDAIRDEHVKVLRRGARPWNEWRRGQPGLRPLLYEGRLDREELSGANLANANMIGSHLSNTTLVGANFHEANLAGADLSNANLTKANFCRTDLYETNLQHANLRSANLQGTQLAKTDFRGAELVGCRIYGLSAWDLRIDEHTIQKDLVILYENESNDGQRRGLRRVIVDDLRVAQLIYLLLHNKNIREVVDTVGRQAVLILGRFESPAYKEVLDRIREWLRDNKHVPIVFDFEGPSHLDTLETVKILAGLSRFVIADLTDPRSVPAELAAIVPAYKIPVVSIIRKGQEPFSLFATLRQDRPWVLSEVVYPSVEVLVREMDRAVVGRALEAEGHIRARRNTICERVELLE
ncbi:MAG: pentapeptide repeat-containing protein [Myxococcales bacterium]